MGISELKIPTAQRFDLDAEMSDSSSDIPRTLPTRKEFQKHLRTLGIDNYSLVVVYGKRGMDSTPRAWWMLKSAGVQNVILVDGGLTAWIAAENRTEFWEDKAASQNKGNITVSSSFGSNSASMQWLQASGSQLEIPIVDARSTERYHGEAEKPRKGLNRGHILGAINIPVTTLQANGQLVSSDQFLSIFDQHLGCANRPFIAYSGSGVTACVVLFASSLIGRHRMLDDGSWSQWGNTRLRQSGCYQG
ncbi:sulfurtransferase [Corynebacterium diphtheriae]|nr:sulfurtransferase [Corynebacterium diphtheriae]OJH87539.1 sulfurtransferase [Corynebacterium diphtheriae]OJH88580.1 sulfurtransferase [Corynebacterium diphtheriae]OJH96789.1 sulfurtransferase [Corynebacterium diphtheriae]OSP98375.1 sulfurtransferase [Corynebacterium diphtheriae]